MRNWLIRGTVVAVAAAVLAGCGGKAPKNKLGVPQWVLNPTVENGIAATDCVGWTGNMSIDRKQAIANARAAIAQQIQVKVQAMDKTYQSKTTADGETTTGSTFESVSKQITQQNLNGAMPRKVDLVKIDGKKNLCAMVAFSPKATEELFKDIVEASGKNLNPQSEKALYQEFKAHKAQEEMQKSLQE
jgi:hypothetical protein